MGLLSSVNSTHCGLVSTIDGLMASCARILTIELERLISMMSAFCMVESTVVGGPTASSNDVPGTSFIHELIVMLDAAVVMASTAALVVAITESLPLPS